MKVDTKILCEIARSAGDIIMDIYNSSDFKTEVKSDSSPVTIADKKVDEFIRIELQKVYADIPIISEEAELPSFEVRKMWSHCFIVDPLDGTKEFIKRNGEFTVNIAYVKDGRPVEGVVFAPAKNLMYFTKGGKAYLGQQELPLKKTYSKFRILTSRSHVNSETQKFIDQEKNRNPDIETIAVGSSLKLCMIADGTADLYPRFGPTSEWDIAAAQAIVEQAGGGVVSMISNKPLSFNKHNMLNDWFKSFCSINR